MKSHLQRHFEMKDFSPLNYFLGLEVTPDNEGYNLSQTKYEPDLLSRACLTDNKVNSMSLDCNVQLTPTEGVPLEDPTIYRQLVGGLIYLTITDPLQLM